LIVEVLSAEWTVSVSRLSISLVSILDPPPMLPLSFSPRPEAHRRIMPESRSSTPSPSTPNTPAPFLEACRGRFVSPTPIWLMRQAGRFLPEYREIRAIADFLTICRTPDLAAEVTLQPVRRLGVDAAIIFCDILVPLEMMGVKVAFDDAPVLDPAVRTREQIDSLALPADQSHVSFLHEALRMVREQLPPQVALIGFAGGPFTLANYLIEGKSSHTNLETKRLLFAAPAVVHALLDKLTELTIAYLAGQVREGGAQALQVFESSAALLAPDDFAEFALPYARRVVEGVKGLGVPVIYFPRGGGASLERAAETGADVIGIDWQTSIGDACRRLPPGIAVQGNLDPTALLGTQEEIRKRVMRIFEEVDRGRGFIFNLGHGVLPPTPPENAEYLVELVHSVSR